MLSQWFGCLTQHLLLLQGASSWQQLQRMLVTSILASLGGAVSRSSIPQAGVTSSSNPNVLPAAAGYQLLVQCEAVKSAHWAFRLYLARWVGRWVCCVPCSGEKGGQMEQWFQSVAAEGYQQLLLC